MNNTSIILMIAIVFFALKGSPEKNGINKKNNLIDILDSQEGKNLLHTPEFLTIAKTMEFENFLNTLDEKILTKLNLIMS